MCKFIIFTLTLCYILFKSTDCALSYDQRQTGDLNVQIGLKNIHLIALLKGGTEEYVDYDYAYDYSEMTIKPQHGSTTSKPSNVTNAPIISEANTTEYNVTSTDIQINSTESSNNDYTESALVTNHTADFEFTNSSSISTTPKIFDGTTSEFPEAPQMSSASPVASHKCRRGFVQNNQGKCEYKVHGTTNALRRIVKLAQKIKIGRGVVGT